MLSADICARARLARDARFDERFFTGVLTMRIYCRPICPVKPAKSTNVAGFSSIRRFNTVFKDTYGRPPSHRKRASRGGNLNGRTVTIQLAYRPPFNWSLLAALLATEATPGVEAVRDGEYRRTIAIDQAAGWFSV